MSRAWITTLAAGILLLAALGVAIEPYWHGLATYVWWKVALVLTLGVYGACFAAVSFPRILDPKLDIPVLAWIGLFAVYMVGAWGRTERARERGDPDWVNANDNKDDFGPGADRKHMGRGWAIFATLVSLGMMAGSVALSRAFALRAVGAPAATTTTAAQKPAPKPVAVPPAPPAAPRTILEAADFPAAIAFALPSMTDDRSGPNAGAKLLAKYGAAKLTWADVAVPNNETSLELVEKDPSKAWGKRLCASGTLARIEKQIVDGVELYSARLVTRTGDAIELYAVGDTGNLVKRKPARFCGVVTGRLDASGKPATFAVGMFEIAKR